MDQFLALTRALSDPNRVRALMALRFGELCVCQIIELLRLAPSTVSKHMTILKQAGLVKNRKEERWMYYRLPEKNEMPSSDIQPAFAWVFGTLDHDKTIQEDLPSIQKIISRDLSKLCKQQRCK